MNIEDLRFPIGEFIYNKKPTSLMIEGWKESIISLPKKLQEKVKNLSDNELNYQYRPKSWTVKQIVHHLADSHINSFIRFKLALTESNPTIRPYDESAWALTVDADNSEIQPSLQLLEGLHARWGILLNNLTDSELNKTLYHPEVDKKISLAELIGMYAWHSEHHLAHINLALKQKI